MSELTKKQIDFCESYVLTRNARESARVAGYAESYCNAQSHQLLKNDKIKNRITSLDEEYFNDEFKLLSRKAISKIKDILNSSDIEAVQLQAVKLVLQVGGYLESDNTKIEVNQQNNTDVKQIEIKFV